MKRSLSQFVHTLYKKRSTSGFTLVELLVTVGIFTLMTTYLVVKYGSFNQSVLVTNTTYDIALTIRQAQNSGTNVQQATQNNFDTGFGVGFSSTAQSGSTVPHNKSFVYFPDISDDGRYQNTGNEATLKTLYTMRRGIYVSSICAGTETSCQPVTSLDIVFKRPNPTALMSSATQNNYAFARITLSSEDGSHVRSVSIRRNGQISVED